MSLLFNGIIELSREDAQAFADQDNEQKLKEEVNETSQKESHEINTDLTSEGIYKPGQALREKEHTFFARILDFSQFKLATRAQVQEQWAVNVERTDDNASKGNIRVRKVTKRNGKVHYELTVKNKVQEGSIETTVPTTEAMYLQMRALASKGMFKHRYTFPIKGTGLKWEVDAVPDGNGGYYPWVRIEIEVKDLKDKVPELPIKTEELISPPELSNITPEEHEAKTQPLMERFFLAKNPFLSETKGEDSGDTKLMGKADTEDDTENAESKPEDGEADNQSDAEIEAKKEEAKDATLSVDNITDDKETAEKVETRAEQIKEAKGIGEGDEADDAGDAEAGDETEATEADESGDEGDENAGEADDNAEGEDDSEESEGEQPGWEEPAEGKGESDESEGEVAKESFTPSNVDVLSLEAFEKALAQGITPMVEVHHDDKIEVEVEVGDVEVEVEITPKEAESEDKPEGESEEESTPEEGTTVQDDKAPEQVVYAHLSSEPLENQ